MPQVLPAIAYYGATYYGASALVATVIATAVSVAVADYQRKKANRQARDAYNASLEDRLVMAASSTGVRSRIYGECRNVDGILFKGTHGANSQFYTLVVGLAGHECEAIPEVYFNDQKLELISDGAGGFWVNTRPYRRTDDKSGQETMSIVGTTASVTLPYTPVAGSVAVISVAAGGEESITLTPTVVGNTVTATVPPLLTGLTFVCTYQYGVEVRKARLWKYLGTASQDIGSDLLASRFPGLINAGSNDDRFAGICAVVVELEYDQDAFPAGLPQVTALVRGAKVLDPRTGITAWTRNSSLIARDWSLYSRGGGCSADDLPDAMVIAAANACDISTAFQTPSGTEMRPLYQCDMVCRLDVNPDQHLAEIVESMAGKWGWAGGRLRWVAGTYREPVADITVDWVTDVESIVVVPQPARQDMVNVYRPTIAAADQPVDGTTGQTAAYTAFALPEVRSEGYITEDGEELPREITLSAVQHNVHAQHICGVLMRDAHEGLTLKLPCNMRAWPLELFDVVRVTLPMYGFAAKEFEVLGWSFSIDRAVILTLKETAASISDVDLLFQNPTSSPNSSLVLPWVVEDVVDLDVDDAPQDGTQQSRVSVTWDAMTSANVTQSGKVEVQYFPIDGGAMPDTWPSWIEEGSSTGAVIPGLRSDTYYLFRARAINTLGVRGTWCQHVIHRTSVPLIETPQLDPNAATEVVQGALDTTVYGGGADLAGTVSFTPAYDARASVIAYGNMRATNSTGSPTNMRGILAARVKQGATVVGGQGGQFRSQVAAGETREVIVSYSFSANVLAGVSYTAGIYYTDHISGMNTELTDVLTRVELIYR